MPPASASFAVPVTGSSLQPGLSPSPSPSQSRMRTRIVLIASSDASLRERLRQSLGGLRWQVLEAPGGAEAWVAAQAVTQLEALLIDPWLPDLEVEEFLRDFHAEYPQVDLMMTDGAPFEQSGRSSYRQELLYAIRRSHDEDGAAWQTAPTRDENGDSWGNLRDGKSALSSLAGAPPVNAIAGETPARVEGSLPSEAEEERDRRLIALVPQAVSRRESSTVERIPELIGTAPAMLEVSRRIRLVAAKSTPVLIEGPTGSGKELVAEALHRLSSRSRKPFVAINCAAIPEALLEAELFGHTRGAFTGAVQGRTGRIESAEGGTLFLDEIGEMPLALQAKLLRFFESGELQRIGDNETVKVDVRIVAATHQRLAEGAQKGLFRADLYYRLAVFLIHTPALAEHMEDLPQLVSHFLERMGRRSPVKRIDAEAMAKLAGHNWPGNVRELEHVLERASILAGDEPVISEAEIDFGLSPVN